MPALEAWEAVYIQTDRRNGQIFLESTHGQMACQACHAGPDDRTFANAEEAHVGVIRDPSMPAADGSISACQGCHASEVESAANSLHQNLWGYYTAIEARCDCTVQGGDLQPFFDAKCATCHTTCGQCHVSRPTSVGGGFPVIATQYNSHRFRSPHMTEQCTACHGSRVGTDYQGQIEGNVGDVHYTNYAQGCDDCHTMEEMHGDGQYDGDHYEHRYEVATMPRCENCHAEDTVVDTSPSADCSRCHVNGVGFDPVEVPAALVNHAHHIADNSTCSHCHRDGVPASTPTNMQCQVCHSQPYKNCTNCHNLVADEKLEKYDINPSRVQFKIARNASPYRPEYDNVLVRHVPVDPGTFADWDGLTLPDYLTVPTWKYTSPHNVIAQTPQTTVPEGGSCYTACHSTPDSPEGWFLRESDLYEEGGVTPLPDREANLGILIPAEFPGSK